MGLQFIIIEGDETNGFVSNLSTDPAALEGPLPLSQILADAAKRRLEEGAGTTHIAVREPKGERMLTLSLDSSPTP